MIEDSKPIIKVILNLLIAAFQTKNFAAISSNTAIANPAAPKK